MRGKKQIQSGTTVCFHISLFILVFLDHHQAVYINTGNEGTSAGYGHIYFPVRSHRDVYVYCHFTFILSFFVLHPDDGPEGPEYAVYMKTHSCVRQYLTIYVMSVRSTRCPPSF